ncbi:exodeoxyribonuclease I [Salinimonas marina]|uniref:Exodeoxyribonuclease I n=1 Tax=Salinimonas marina TaxID=2785918 RepID=A0A7S9DV17_9ALTE|nr:exodeoxyribonuclease I [Salinimonas marina]QPG04497.1 exodeoxyribonuclease I [Salinimonas marina]
MTTAPSMLWHDYETFGTSVQKDLPCQFAAIRTDMDLNVIGKPINIISQIANDYLPNPGACLVTGITPQQTLRDGRTEADFARQVAKAMSQPNTCVAGYNSIRFDDEVSRHLFYRNFIDPYAREWRNGNSRWDIIDLARACYALRPDGIKWPTKDDGTPSFKLEDLCAANELEHGHAHDALSDVTATIALAKLIKTQQPRLYDYAFSLRSKHTVLKQFDFSRPSVVLHISSKLPARQGCASWVMPVCPHPVNANAIIAIDLNHEVQPLLELEPEELRRRLYLSHEQLEGLPRPGLKLIHINRSPFVTTAKAMTQENAERLGLNRDYCLDNFKQLSQAEGLATRLTSVYASEREAMTDDIDHALYSGGFLTDEERRWCEQVHDTDPEQLTSLADKTQNQKLRDMLFRYRARNYSHTLTESELQRWHSHRQFRLTDPESPASITLAAYLEEIERLSVEHSSDPNKQAILRALYHYAENL